MAERSETDTDAGRSGPPPVDMSTARERGTSFFDMFDGASNADEELDESPRLQCLLGFHNRFFRAGDAVRGMVLVVPTGDLRATAIKIRWTGIEHVYWSAGLNRSEHISKDHSVFSEETVLWSAAEGQDGLPVGADGVFRADFSWQLPAGIPRAFEETDNMPLAAELASPLGAFARGLQQRMGRFGVAGVGPGRVPSHVRYCATVVLCGCDSDGDEDGTQEQPVAQSLLTVFERALPHELSTPVERMASKTYAFGGRQPCVLQATLGSTVLFTGQPTQLALNVSNGSRRTIRGFEMRLWRKVVMCADVEVPLRGSDEKPQSAGVEVSGGTAGDAAGSAATAAAGAAGGKDERDRTNSLTASRVAQKEDLVFTGLINFPPPVAPTGSISPDEAAASADAASTQHEPSLEVGPETSKALSLEVRLPRTIPGSVTNGTCIKVTHTLAIHLKVRGATDLVLKMPVTVVDSVCEPKPSLPPPPPPPSNPAPSPSAPAQSDAAATPHVDGATAETASTAAPPEPDTASATQAEPTAQQAPATKPADAPKPPPEAAAHDGDSNEDSCEEVTLD